MRLPVRFLFALLASGATLGGGMAPLSAQEVSAEDIALWQSVQNSPDVDDYRRYLQAFPRGAFAELAQLRIVQLSGTTDDSASRAAGNGVLANNSNDVGDAIITIDPPTFRVGDQARVTFTNMPNPGSSDIVIVVEAGAPENTGIAGSDGVIAYQYASTVRDSGMDIGPLAPGDYEIRWLTTLYNNERRLEVGSRAMLSVVR